MNSLGSTNAARAVEQAVGEAMREVADRIIMPAFAGGELGSAHFKTPGEIVTDVDRRSEAYLMERLVKILPDAKVVGEEAAHQDPSLLEHLASGPCWIIDPLDGTGNFVAGKPPFGVLVALASDGLPIAGWLLDPVSGRLCTAIAEAGARIDGEPIHVRSLKSAIPRIAVTKLFPDAARRAALMEGLMPAYDVRDAPRCAAELYPGIVTGALDVALFTRTIAWDHAAGVLFLNEAGGRARRPDGAEYRCDDPGGGLVAASSPDLWEGIASALSALPAYLRYSD